MSYLSSCSVHQSSATGLSSTILKLEEILSWVVQANCELGTGLTIIDCEKVILRKDCGENQSMFVSIYHSSEQQWFIELENKVVVRILQEFIAIALYSLEMEGKHQMFCCALVDKMLMTGLVSGGFYIQKASTEIVKYLLPRFYSLMTV